ncbi:MAG: hypothetical protein ACM3O7_11530, partial [Acidobacteriota bacterium]
MVESVGSKRILALALAALFVAAACQSTASQSPGPGESNPPASGGEATPLPTGGGPTGLNVPIGDASRADQEYVWISNASNLPLFVERVYPGLESA